MEAILAPMFSIMDWYAWIKLQITPSNDKVWLSYYMILVTTYFSTISAVLIYNPSPLYFLYFLSYQSYVFLCSCVLTFVGLVFSSDCLHPDSNRCVEKHGFLWSSTLASTLAVWADVRRNKTQPNDFAIQDRKKSDISCPWPELNPIQGRQH